MNIQIFSSTIFILLLIQVLAPIPVWDFNSITVDLFSGSERSYDYILYDKKENGISVVLKKTIVKMDNKIMSHNYITIDSITHEVDFEDIGSQYTNKLGYDILICPKGKFHPYDFKNNKYIEPSEFEGYDYELVNCEKFDISSTDLREKNKEETIKEVKEYIFENGLYN